MGVVSQFRQTGRLFERYHQAHERCLVYEYPRSFVLAHRLMLRTSHSLAMSMLSYVACSAYGEDPIVGINLAGLEQALLWTGLGVMHFGTTHRVGGNADRDRKNCHERCVVCWSSGSE